MQFKKFVCACTLGAFLATSAGTLTPAEAADSANIIIDGTVYQCDSSCAPQNINGRVYVPLRVVSEGLGHQVEWDNDTRTVFIGSKPTNIDNTTSVHSSLQIYINGQQLDVDLSTGVPYITPTGYTMVPVRIVAENLGASVNWNSSSNSVTITTDNSSVTPLPPDNGNGSVDNGNSGSAQEPDNGNRPQSADQVTLMGASYCSLEQMQRYINNLENTVRARCIANGTAFVPFPDNIAYQYYTIGQKYGIRGDVALAQALLETGNFQYGNEVKPWQNNYCGLGAVGHTATEEEVAASWLTNVDHNRAWLQVGIHGWIYDSVATGVEAHIQHLYSYATTASLPSGCTLVDGRFNHGNRGVAKVLTDLNGKWAVPGNGYGENIFNNMLVKMMNS
ncbi:MAG: stalk domain-containing protein [Peptococcaceae bacterium]|nr:stalk domain-containing protein [Peptococcaceae bacterium]